MFAQTIISWDERLNNTASYDDSNVHSWINIKLLWSFKAWIWENSSRHVLLRELWIVNLWKRRRQESFQVEKEINTEFHSRQTLFVHCISSRRILLERSTSFLLLGPPPKVQMVQRKVLLRNCCFVVEMLTTRVNENFYLASNVLFPLIVFDFFSSPDFFVFLLFWWWLFNNLSDETTT